MIIHQLSGFMHLNLLEPFQHEHIWQQYSTEIMGI